MEARSLGDAQCEFLHNHLRVLSGLYGAVRGMDYIQPYRLCMGTKLSFTAPDEKGKTRKHSSLYEYWRPRLTQYFVKELEQAEEKLVVNLASMEYWKAVDERVLEEAGARIITCSFLNDGRNLSVFCKKARGLMCRCSAMRQRPLRGLMHTCSLTE